MGNSSVRYALDPSNPAAPLYSASPSLPFQPPSSYSDLQPLPNVYKIILFADNAPEASKMRVNHEEVEALLRTVDSTGHPAKIIGVYGTEDMSKRFMSSVLNVNMESLSMPEEMNEGIVACIGPEANTLCFYFKIEQEKTYMVKPYSPRPQELQYLNLLFKMCPVVVCCISEDIQRSWYCSEEQRAQCFESTPIDEMAIALPAQIRENCVLANDSWPLLFATGYGGRDLSEKVSSAMQRLALWLSSKRALIRKSGWSEFLSSPRDYDNELYWTFITALKSLTCQYETIEILVKQKFEAFKDGIREELERCFMNFCNSLQRKFTLKQERNSWLKNERIDDVIASIRTEFVEKGQHERLFSHWSRVRKFVVGLQSQAEVFDQNDSVRSFFADQHKEILNHINTFGFEQLDKLIEELKVCIKDIASHNNEICCIKVFDITASESEIKVVDRRVETHFTLYNHPSRITINVLNEKNALVIAEGVGQIETFNPCVWRFDEKEASPNIQLDMLIASGSTTDLLVAFFNREKRAIYGESHEIQTGTNLRVYGQHIHYVQSACVLQQTRRCLMISQQGQVFSVQISSNTEWPEPVFIKQRRTECSEEDSEPKGRAKDTMQLYFQRQTLFYEVQCAADEQLYYLRTNTAIEIYDTKFTFLKQVPLKYPITAFKSLKFENYHFLITQSENQLTSLRFWDLTTNTSEQAMFGQIVISCNPSIDILWHTFFGGNFPPVNSDARSQFYLYPKSCERLCESYVKSFPAFDQVLQFRGTIQDSGESLLAELPAMNAFEIKEKMIGISQIHLGFPVVNKSEKCEEAEESVIAMDPASLIAYKVFSSHVDVAQNFRLRKWMLNLDQAKELIHAFSATESPIKVIGAYGPVDIALSFIGTVLRVNHEYLRVPDEPNEGLVAYFRADIRTLCFLFKIEQEEVYLTKPYPSSSRESIYIRLLFDLCSAVVCCISEAIQKDWYSSEDPQLKNPFVPKNHSIMKVKFIRKKLRSSEIEEIPVILPACRSGKFILSSDHFPFISTTNYVTKDVEALSTQAITAVTRWLSGIKPLSRSPPHFWKEFFEPEFNEYDSGSFLTLATALRALSEEATNQVPIVKEKYKTTKESMHSRIKVWFQRDFLEEFQAKFQVRSTHSRYLGFVTCTFEEFKKKMHESCVKNCDYSCIMSFLREAAEFVEKTKEPTKRKKDDVVNDFFKQKSDEIKVIIDKISNEAFDALEDQLLALIEEQVSKNTEKLSITTLPIEISQDRVTVSERGVESRLSMLKRPYGLVLYMLSLEAAFSMAKGSTQTFKYNPTINNKYDIEELKSIKSCGLIASGSTISLFVAFYNDEKKAIYGAAKEMKHINIGISLKIYGDQVKGVISACVLQKTHRTIFINEYGTVYSMELTSSAKRLIPVMVDSRETRTDDAEATVETLRRPLTPVNGRIFIDVKSSVDETLYFFLTDTAVEIYDVNYVLSRTVLLRDPSVSLKVLASEDYNIMLIQSSSELKAYRFQGDTERVEGRVEKFKHNNVPGNPILDITHHALTKFGRYNLVSDSRTNFYIYSQNPMQECVDYFNSMPLLTQALDFKGSLTAKQPKEIIAIVSDIVGLEAEDLKWRILTRAPIHLVSIQDGNLVPLQDGLNNYEEFIKQISDSRTNFTTAFVSYVRLGALEPILKDAKNIKVVSIIGRQSSGKSYLLNRIFGTRFDVASHRCTDGIWMSVARLQNQTFVVLDCEGLFSSERSEVEEIKLCLLLSAISDVTILNQDLTLNRNLNSLFEKFTSGIDRLNGSKLFKGSLELAIRDVAENQDDGVIVELEKYVKNLTMTNKADFLKKLFSDKFTCFCYHNFENDKQFESDVNSQRQCYLDSIPMRWGSGEEFSIILKTVTGQIYSDDATSIDSRTFQLKLGHVSAVLRKAIEVPSAVRELLFPENPQVNVSVTIADKSYSFTLGLFDIEISLVSKYTVFNSFMGKRVPAELMYSEHNLWYQALEIFMKTYFEVYKLALFEYYAKSVTVTEEYRSIFAGEKNILETTFDNLLLQSHTICLRKCEKCDLCCVKSQNHVANCDCSTSHKCLFMCSICGSSEMCSQHAGHTSRHFCSGKAHTCGLPCELRGCTLICTAAPNHGDTHRCSAPLHPCGEKCSIFHLCGHTCQIDQLIEHSQHNCEERSCPYECDICPDKLKSRCASQDHLHSLSKDPLEIIHPETGKLMHFCSKEQHFCVAPCEINGACGFECVTERRIWENESNTFPYTYMSQKDIRNTCSTPIPKRRIKHEGGHVCGTKKHTCMTTCPDCGAYCEEIFGHSGVHSSAVHRNKEKCIYVAKKKEIEYVVEEERKKTTRKLKAGEVAKPEFCDQSCARKGRGHTHPIECKGGYRCLQVTHEGKAMHSKEQYYPDLSRVYDLVECETYWLLSGWEPPVFKRYPDAQNLFALCPYYCASAEHTEKVYCEGKLFHSNSLALKDHIFPSCSHSAPSELDIVFVLDCTGSMGRSFPEVKKVITEVINKYRDTSFSTKFAIVGYTDHAPDNGSFPEDPPVSIYPPSKQIADFEETDALAFLTALRATGGGGKLGEAMLDGINESNSLGWRPYASRLVFIIADDCPHGDIFAVGTQHPNGCPCGLNLKTLLATMKEQSTEIKLINMSSALLNKTVDFFKEEYGEGFESMALESMSNISKVVLQSIVAVIEYNLEFALTDSV